MQQLAFSFMLLAVFTFLVPLICLTFPFHGVEALLLIYDVGFVVKGPSVSRILTLLSKTTVFDP